MTLNEQEKAYMIALMDTYGATFDFYLRVDSHLSEDKRRFNELTERVGLVDAVNEGLRFDLTEKLKDSIGKEEGGIHTYIEQELNEIYAKAYGEMGNMSQTEDELWGVTTVEN